MDISIRPYRLDDAPWLYEAAIESVKEIYPFMPWCHPDLSMNELWKWVNTQVSAFDARATFEFVIQSEDGRFLGGCGLNQIDNENRRANLGYWVRTSATRHGVATIAIQKLVDWAFKNTDLIRLEVIVSSQNSPSLRAAEKAGAIREGILKKRLFLHGISHDAVVFSFVHNSK